MRKQRWLLLGLAVAALSGLCAFVFTRPKPHYCRLVFGPEGKVRVLVCLRGHVVYVDRNGDGQLDDPGERFVRRSDTAFLLTDPDGKASYAIVNIEDLELVPPAKGLSVDVNVRGPLQYRQGCFVQLSPDRRSAPVAHFDGPLTVTVHQSMKLESGQMAWRADPDLRLQKGDKPSELYANVGTLTAGGRVTVCSQDETGRPLFPPGAHPFAEIEFPAREPGSPSVKKRYPLDKHC